MEGFGRYGHDDYETLMRGLSDDPNFAQNDNDTRVIGTEYALSQDKMLTYSKFQGKDYVHIRIHGQNETSGKRFPTKKGIALTPMQFAALISMFGHIDRNYEDLQKPENLNHEPYRVHISGLVYVWITPGIRCIHVRHAYKKEGKILPSKFKVCTFQ